MIKGFR